MGKNSVLSLLASSSGSALVAVVMGSQSDWRVMKRAAERLGELGISYEVCVVSAHRTPRRLYEFASEAQARGFRLIIAGAGGAAHLPGMVASLTRLPVLGVPVGLSSLSGIDSLLSIVQMPAGVPVGTLAVGESGAENAALLAARILALSDAELASRLEAFHQRQSEGVPLTPESS